MNKLQELIDYVSSMNIEIQFCGSPNDLEGYQDIGLGHNVNGCVDIISRTIMIFCDDIQKEEELIRSCIIHEFGHIISCTYGEITAWNSGINSVPRNLVPENIHMIKQKCLENYSEEWLY